MTAPNRATLWGRTVVDELAKSGVDDVCLAPGSRCTPLTVAAADHEGVTTYSHLDERSAAFFALGRARRSGEPVALVCTSGTAAANFHPAVIEAHHSRVPLVVLTADRPAELHDSGANQTIEQDGLYGDATRMARTLPEPVPEARRLRSVRTTVCRAAAAATGSHPGPIHLNVPFAKPLEPTPVDGDVPDEFGATHGEVVDGREGPWVHTDAGRPTLDDATLDDLVEIIRGSDAGLVVAGPSNAPAPTREALARLADATGYPVLADPLSGHRFGDHVDGRPILGGYDGYVDGATEWPDPDVVLRFGASPTSKALRKYLRDADARSILIDPAGGWREAEFSATDHVVADETSVAGAVAEAVSREPGPLAERFADAEQRHWERVEAAVAECDAAPKGAARPADGPVEGAAAATVVDALPDPATLYVSNSMPIRDVDRFARPRDADLSVLGNRGASGIDGIVSSALGAASATDEPLVCLLGDLALYHDMNGLLAVDRLGIDATFVVVNNDGGGIFHELPIEEFDPPFTDLFRTPHGLDFAPTGELYDLNFERVGALDELAEAVADSTAADGTQVLEISVDAAASHRARGRTFDE